MMPPLNDDRLFNYVRNHVLQHSLNAYKAGGCARDKAFGLPTKDVDVIIPSGFLCDSEVFEIAENLCYNLRVCYPESVGVDILLAYGVDEDEGEFTLADDRSDFDQSIKLLLKISSLDNSFKEMDVLFYNTETIEEALGHFDANINQVYLDDKGEVVWLAGHPPKEIIIIKEVKESRTIRLKEIFNKIPLKVRYEYA